MKSKFLLSVLASLCLIVKTQAQITKGSLWLGGSASYNSAKNDNTGGNRTKNQTFIFNPGIGKAIKDNTIAGIDILYSNKKENVTNGIISREINSYGIGFFVRRYVPVINRLYIFGQGRAGFSFEETKDDYGSGKWKTEGWNTGLTFNPGVSFAVNNKLHLESGFNRLLYVQYSQTKNALSKNSSFSAGVNLDNSSSFYIGFRLLINKKS